MAYLNRINQKIIEYGLGIARLGVLHVSMHQIGVFVSICSQGPLRKK